ncbi:hypothetical protein RHMOL_Rhmol06G0195500 [Rhododendron molle]|uniref:Uncharacterized protein n=1 Tax=Rhododendron molle TaxID=49168 RepID=A0ACC0NG33_RHOML|nr:hypothetical protein RHMOL_Rhmol06G0195500 [Rhododendron molle]
MAAPNPTTSLPAAAAAGGGAVTAPRWIPKRGRVLRNVLKMCFACLCSQGRKRRRSKKSVVLPSIP